MPLYPAFILLSHSSSLAVEHRSYEPGVVGSIPTWSILHRSSARSVMVIIGASQALDPGSIPGERRIGALAQSEECVLCKHEVRGSKPRCSRYFLFFCASAKFSFRKCSISEGYRLGWPSGPRRSTQVRVSSEAWVRIPLQAISRGIGLVV